MDNLKEDTVVKFVLLKQSWGDLQKYWLLTHLAQLHLIKLALNPQHYSKDPIPKKNRDGNKRRFFSHLTFIWIFCLLYSALISYKFIWQALVVKLDTKFFPSWKPTSDLASLYYCFYKKGASLWWCKTSYSCKRHWAAQLWVGIQQLISSLCSTGFIVIRRCGQSEDRKEKNT